MAPTRHFHVERAFPVRQRYNIVMTDSSDSVCPEWLFIMRHAQAARPHEKTADPHSRARQVGAPAEVLTPHGCTEAREVGGTLASVLDDLRRADCPVEVTRFMHERTEVALATALAFRRAYEQTADAIKTEHGRGSPPLARMEPIDRELSAYESDPDSWADKTIERITKAGPAPKRGESAALIIGHDPGMSCLLTTLLDRNAPRVGRYRDVPGLTRAELLGLRWDGRYWRPVWALTSGAAGDIAEIKEKIRSKMDTAKVFGGFITAVLTFVVSQYAMTTPKTMYWAAVRGVSLMALAVAILLYLMTLFWYDRLLMPPRFWGILRGRKEDAVSKVLRRPPSSAVWVLYQNMQRIWRLLFVPATYAAAVGIVGFAAARIEPSATTALIIFSAAAVVVTLTAWWGWRSRPILGVQD
jgi:phosphohistidine phosphatase SixA